MIKIKTGGKTYIEKPMHEQIDLSMEEGELMKGVVERKRKGVFAACMRVVCVCV